MDEQAVKDVIDHCFSTLNTKDLKGVSVACRTTFSGDGNIPSINGIADDLFYVVSEPVSDDGWGYSD